MRERPGVSPRSAERRTPATIDVAVLTPRGRQLAVLLARKAVPRASWELPWSDLRNGEALDAAARRLVRQASGADPAWLEQVGAFGDGKRHPAGLELSVCFAALLPHEPAAEDETKAKWFDASALPALAPRQRAMTDAALQEVRRRMDHSPVAFRLLPDVFTLSDLQQMYELLLGRRLHKASFRRALQAAFLVEPTDEWRSEGRGRPAQLFRYAPRRRRGGRRPVRFDLLA